MGDEPTTQVLASPAEEELWRRMVAGDEEAFGALYRRTQGKIYRFALRMTCSEAIAEDVTQEVFMTLIQEAERYDPVRGSLLTYLYGIARIHVLRRLDRDRAYVPIMDAHENGHIAPEERQILQDDPLGNLTRNEVIDSVRQAVLSLPVHYREVIVLCDLHEQSYTEASAALGCAVGTVRSRLHRARALLLEKLRAARHSGPVSRRIGSTRY